MADRQPEAERHPDTRVVRSNERERQMRNLSDFRTAMRLGTLVMVAGVLSACGGAMDGGEAGDQTYLIKFPHVTAPGTPKGRTAQRFKELAEERFPGRVTVEVYPSSQLMNDDDSLEALAFGEIRVGDET